MVVTLGFGAMTRLAVLLVIATGLATVPGPADAVARATCRGIEATIVGTGGDDDITGTPGDDVIVALGGDDSVDPGGGDDVVCGGRGRDHLRSDRGRDVLVGGPQGDHIEAHSPRPAV